MPERIKDDTLEHVPFTALSQSQLMEIRLNPTRLHSSVCRNVSVNRDHARGVCLSIDEMPVYFGIRNQRDTSSIASMAKCCSGSMVSRVLAVI